MTVPKFLRKKSTYIILGILLVGGGLFARSRSQNALATYETAPVEKRDLLQTVEVTGELKPAARVELSFKNSGIIGAINVEIGDTVKKGDVLAVLQEDDVSFSVRNAAAALSIARANLDAQLAGETAQSIRVAETQVEQAQASYNKALADLSATKLTTQNAVTVSEVALQTAQNNLENQDAILDQNTQDAHESARASLVSALGPLQTSLVDGDSVTAVDNTNAAAEFSNVLGFLDSAALPRAKNSYLIAKASKLAADKAVIALNTSSSKEDIQAAGVVLQTAIADMQTYLNDVQKLLAATLTSVEFTATELAAKKSTIDADRTSVSTQNSTVLAALQSIKNSELTRTETLAGLQDAYTTALTNLETAKTNAITQVSGGETNVAIQKAALDAAVAGLELKQAGPRSVDVAGLRASVEQAQVNYDKAINDLENVQIVSPVDGTVAEVEPSVGELIQAGAVAIRLVGTEHYDIEALVPEADIAKVEVGQTATMTLDAFGDDTVFNGTVTAEDPDLTKVQEAVYYRIRVQIEPAGKDVKPGMTANVTLKTDERKGALVIPLRAVRTRDTDQAKTVRVLVGKEAQEKVIELGLRGDEGRVEVTTGLSEGEQVVVGEKASGLQP